MKEEGKIKKTKGPRAHTTTTNKSVLVVNKTFPKESLSQETVSKQNLKERATPQVRERKAIFHHRMPDGKLVLCGWWPNP